MSLNSPPFTYPGVTIEPSMYKLYKDSREGRFRLGNQYVTKDWKDNLAKIAWDTLPLVTKDKIQGFIQAELGYAFGRFNKNISVVQAIKKNEDAKCVWYCMIQQTNLDDIVVLRMEFRSVANSQYKISMVEFVGYTPKDKLGDLSVGRDVHSDTDGMPTKRIVTSAPASTVEHTLASNMLHRNFIPGSILTLDTTSVHTLGKQDHAIFSSELDKNWPTTLHPNSNSNSSKQT